MNPIILREWKSRWRHVFSAALVFAACIVVSTALCLSYAGSRVERTDLSVVAASSQMGRQVWLLLGYIQTGAWMLMAAILTATTLSDERERGLLESLQLSHLTPRKIITGKLFSALAFASLIELAILPIHGICFLMGGVSPSEFVGMVGFHALAALTGAALGIFFSATSRRSLASLGKSIGFIAGWTLLALFLSVEYRTLGILILHTLFILLGSGIAIVLTSQTRRSRREAVGINILGGLIGLYWSVNYGVFLFSVSGPTIALALAHPVALAIACFDPDLFFNRRGFFRPPGAIFNGGFWLLIGAFYVVFIIHYLTRAARVLHLLQPDFVPNDRHWTDAARQKLRSNRSGPVPVSVSDSEQTATPTTQLIDKNSEASTADVLLSEIPIDKWINFKNPILQREVRRSFRFRKASFLQGIIQMAVAVGMGLMFLIGIFTVLSSGASSSNQWETWSYLLLLGAVAGGAYLGARGFTREQEAGTLEAINLSLLSHREFITAKLASSLIVVAIYSIPMWIILLCCLIPYRYPHTANIVPVPPSQFIFSALIIIATTWFATSFSLMVSHFSRKTTAAVATAFIALALFFFFSAFILQYIGGAYGRAESYKTYSHHSWGGFFVSLFHPLHLLGNLGDRGTSQYRAPVPWWAPFVNALTSVSLGLACAYITQRRLERTRGGDAQYVDKQQQRENFRAYLKFRLR
jgi:ABC-type transport system involved in multi-copper enzyme maturation permease subunit